ncbi:hypothetical protein BAE44_0004726 [Dichanthelium oligosanthes]|uniref:Uncharacterized protein n=1 Tax=Dichanthelium oligosanthes TaxID=888268 RepID=A0A1E5WA72_9POAL|nr:hypothetical protein BAE44_0004726 [Dichanthelium oligosanthes]
MGDDDDELNRPVGAKAAAHAASLLPPAGRPSAAVTSYLAGLSRQQLREMLGALGREGPGILERAMREYAGLATLVEQAWVPLDMGAASARDAAAAKGRRNGTREIGSGPASRRIPRGSSRRRG